jgi:hypothetical protein
MKKWFGSRLFYEVMGIAGIFLFIIYSINTYNSGNPLWFVPFQPSHTPDRIVVWQDGVRTEYLPDNNKFPSLAEAVASSLKRFRNRQLINAGISETTLESYYKSGTVVEAYYNQPLYFNLPIRMENITQLLIPLDGEFASEQYVFMGRRGAWLVGALQVATTEELDKVVTLIE